MGEGDRERDTTGGGGGRHRERDTTEEGWVGEGDTERERYD